MPGCRYLRLEQIRFLRHYDPCDQVADEADSGHESGDQPDHSNDGYIDIEILRHAHADTRDLASFARTNQAFARNHAADSGTAVCADIGVILNRLSAIVAVHVSSTR